MLRVCSSWRKSWIKRREHCRGDPLRRSGVTTSEWLSLFQTIILLGTGGIVWWYTRETAQIRRETSRQANIQAEHLRILQDQVERDRQREVQALQPKFIVGGGGGFTTEKADLVLRNYGAAIKAVELEPGGDFEMINTRTPYVASGGDVSFQATWAPRPRPEALTVLVSYRDMAEYPRKLRLTYDFDARFIEQELLE